MRLLAGVVARYDSFAGGIGHVSDPAGFLLDGEAHIFAAEYGAKSAVFLVGLHGGAWVE